MAPLLAWVHLQLVHLQLQLVFPSLVFGNVNTSVGTNTGAVTAAGGGGGAPSWPPTVPEERSKHHQIDLLHAVPPNMAAHHQRCLSDGQPPNQQNHVGTQQNVKGRNQSGGKTLDDRFTSTSSASSSEGQPQGLLLAFQGFPVEKVKEEMVTAWA
eukprot:symbB.v1.2.023664.t1/scaffold2182.1/size86529/4